MKSLRGIELPNQNESPQHSELEVPQSPHTWRRQVCRKRGFHRTRKQRTRLGRRNPSEIRFPRRLIRLPSFHPVLSSLFCNSPIRAFVGTTGIGASGRMLPLSSVLNRYKPRARMTRIRYGASDRAIVPYAAYGRLPSGWTRLSCYLAEIADVFISAPGIHRNTFILLELSRRN